MKRILADVSAFGRQYLRSRVGTFFALAFPVILILLFGSIFSSSGSPKVSLAVQDLDMSTASRGFVQALNNTTLIKYQAIPTNVNFQDYMRQHSINVALRIPSGFQDALIQAQMGNKSAKVNVTLAGDQTQSSYGIVYSAVTAVATAYNFRIANATPVVSVAESRLTVRQFGYIDLFLPGIIGFTILTTPMFGMTSICAEFRTRRYFKLLATTRLSKAEWLAAKVIFYVLLLFLSVAIMNVVGVAVFGMQATLTPVALLLIVAGTFEFTSLGMVLGIFVRDPGTGEAIANAIGFPMMFLAGSFFPIDSMPPFLQTIAQGLPLTYINEGLRATMVFGNDATALTYLFITLGFAVAFFVVGARGLSWKSK
jgi:ABC-2 type transport system permease protein